MKPIQISMVELKTQNIRPEDLILDVRTPAEFAEGHVAGSLNIPHDTLSGRIEELRPFQKIYIYCRSGNRVGMAAQTLTQAGFKNLVCVLNSGMGDWISAGFPYEKGNK